MSIAKGDTLPEAKLLRIGESGPEEVTLDSIIGADKAVIFGLPGAFSRTCSSSHLPSFIRTRGRFKENGVDHVICISVNDPFVMAAWGSETGASSAGIEMLADASGAFTKAIGMNFTAPPVGFYDRSKRYAMLVENGKVRLLQAEENSGECTVSGGEALLEAM